MGDHRTYNENANQNGHKPCKQNGTVTQNMYPGPFMVSLRLQVRQSLFFDYFLQVADKRRITHMIEFLLDLPLRFLTFLSIYSSPIVRIL